ARLAGARWIVVKEYADHVAGRIEASDRLIGGVDDARLGVHLDPAKGKSDSGSDRIRPERRLRQRFGPVRFFRRDTDCELAVELAWHERHIATACSVEFVDGSLQRLRLQSDFACEFGN